ncbi:MAG: FdhF/YdeP family oxidoreductase [Acidobacteriota bacterium]
MAKKLTVLTPAQAKGIQAAPRDDIARGPSEAPAVEQREPPAGAAGLKAVAVAMQHMQREGYDPVTATRVLSRMNQKQGFDCPGCAWPDPDDRRSFVAEYCENGAKAMAEEATRKRCDPEFFQRHSVEALGGWTDFELGQAGRITHPMVLRPGATHYRTISWDEAFGEIANHLNALESPDEALFYTSGRTSNEAAFLYQLFVRQFGTNNLPDCSNMCHESSGVGLAETVGIGKGSVSLEDLESAELIVVMGQNPGTNHPRMLSALQTAKRRGAKIVGVNPLREAGLKRFQHPQSPLDLLSGGTELADLYLQVQINGDVAFLKAAMCELLRRETQRPGSAFDQDFITEFTDGYEALVAHLGEQDFDELVAAAGLTAEQVHEFCDLVVARPKMIVCWAMGLTQHKNGVHNIREIVNLLLLRGAIGKPGAGTCPVRGHSNVQGDRTMGIWEQPPEAFLQRLEQEFEFKAPRKHGHSVVHAIEAMRDGEASVFLAMGGNFLSASPDTEVTAAALRSCRLTAHVSTKLNRSHLVHGRTALILPCLGRSEQDEQASGTQFVTVENSMGVVHRSLGTLEPASRHLLSEPRIVAGLAQAVLGDATTVDWGGLAADYAKIRDKIEAVIPGFERYNERVEQPAGFYLPNASRERRFNTRSGHARFTINPVPRLDVGPGELRMMTIRTHDQFNTTVYGLNDRYRGLAGSRRIVMMHPADLEERGLVAEQAVDLLGAGKAAGRVAENFLAVPYDIPRGCVATYFPEANVLVPLDLRADRSHTPASKLVLITVESRGQRRTEENEGEAVAENPVS